MSEAVFVKKIAAFFLTGSRHMTTVPVTVNPQVSSIPHRIDRTNVLLL